MIVMMKRLLSALVLILAPSIASAQTFLSTQTPNVQPTIFGSISLGDFDADGHLDLLVTGSEPGSSTPAIRIYRNEGRLPGGTWSVTDVGAVFPDAHRYLAGIRASSTDIGDFDNDGDLDILLSGSGGTVVYRNEGQFRFTPIRIWEELEVDRGSYFVDIVTSQSSAWGDYDSDGDLDILLATASGTFIYRNDGYGRFTQVDVGLPPLPNGIVSWGDYDNDGDLDILAVSRPFREQAPRTMIFRNDDGVFVDSGAALPGIEAGTVRWGDFDGDGDLDVLVMSRLFTSPAADAARRPGIYRNDRGVFVPLPDTLPAAWYGTWIDYDNDGDLDILLNGLEGNNITAQLIRNDGGRFQHLSPVFPGVWFGDIATGDIDGDGRIEVLMSGRAQAGTMRVNRFLLYRNISPDAKSAPSAPVALASRRDGDNLVLSWRPAWWMVNEHRSVTYNVRVGTTPGGSDVLSPMALSSGKRLVQSQGNAGHNTTISIKGLKSDQTYYWTVQCLDHRNLGSAFASERVSLPVPVEPAPSTPVVTENYPNPFNPSTTIRYTLAEPSDVRIVVYNVLGAEVAVLVNGQAEAGSHEAVWNGTDVSGRLVPSGIYLYSVETAGTRITRSMTLLK